MKKIGLYIVLIVMIASCKNEQVQEKKDTIKIRVVSAKQIDYNKKIRASGTLSSKEEVKLSFKTGGIIEKIYFNEGELFKKGDVLASLNLKEINAKVKQAELSYEKAKRDLQRVKNLYQDSVATLEQLQNAQTALDYAQSNVEIALFNKRYSKIIAPANGKVLKILSEENELIGSGYPVVLVSSDEKEWVVKTSVSDIDVVNIQIDDSAHVFFDAYKDEAFKSKITEISGRSDPYTGTFDLEMRILHANRMLISGMIAKIEIYSSVTEKLIQIPVEAMIEGNESMAYIYVFDGTKAHKKEVDVYEINDGFILVKQGLQKGEQVVIDGVNYIKPESDIEVVE